MTDEEKKAAEEAAAAGEFPFEPPPVESPTVAPQADAPPPMIARPADDTGYSSTHAAQVAADADTPHAPPAEVPLAQKLVHAQEVLNEAAAKGQISKEQYDATSQSIHAQMVDAAKTPDAPHQPDGATSASASGTAKEKPGGGAWNAIERGANKVAGWGPAALGTMIGGPWLGAALAPGVAKAGGQAIGFLPKDGAGGPAAAPKLNPVGLQEHGDTGGTPPPAPQQTTNVPAQSIPKVSPGIRHEILAGEEGQLTGVNEQERAEAEQAAELADAKERAAEDMRVQQVLDEQDRAKQRQAVDDHLAQIQAKSDAVAAKKIDPQEYFKSLSTGQKILGILSMTLSGALEGFTGRPNSGDTLLMKSINDSIETQKANLENERHGIDNDQNIYASKLRLFDDDQKAKAAARQEMLAASLRYLDAMDAKFNSPIIHARAEQYKGQLIQQFGHDQATLETYVPAHQVTTGVPGGQGIISDVKPEQILTLDTLDPRTGQRETVAIADTVLRDKIDGAMTVAASVDGAMTSIKRLLDAPAATKLTPSWQKEYSAATKVFTSPEVQMGGGKGGIGTFKVFSEPLKLTWGVLGKSGALEAAHEIATAKRREANELLNRANPVSVQEVAHINPKTKEQERKFVVLGKRSGAGSVGAEDPSDAIKRLGAQPGAAPPPSAAPSDVKVTPFEVVKPPPKGTGTGVAAPKGKPAGGGARMAAAPTGTFNLAPPR